MTLSLKQDHRDILQTGISHFFYQAVKYKLVKLFEAFKSKPVLHTELSNFFVI